MKAVKLMLSVAVASLLATGAFAQSKGEADPEQSKAAPSAAASKDQKAAARKDRNTAGRSVARASKPADDAPNNLGMARASSKDDRKAAGAKRRAEAVDAVKKGQTTSGEK